MFETMSHLALQQYWWAIIALLAGILVFLLFVQGGQTLLYTIAKSEEERTILVNSLGRKWEFTFTTLVTFGGAFFASFPLFYSTSFGGAYWVWMIILFCFVLQAVAYEYRSKPGNFLGRRTYEVFLFINGALGTILLGTAVATFFTGSEFSVNEMNLSRWETPYHGLEAALNLTNLALGLAVFFLSRTLAVLYFINSISDQPVVYRARRQLLREAIPFVGLFTIFLVMVLTKDGFAYQPETKEVYTLSFKYLHNLLQMPFIAILFLLGVAMVLLGILQAWLRGSSKGIWLSGGGTILTVTMLFLVAGYNQTAFYPSTFDLQSSLTIENSSSSHYTLTVMSYASLFIPVVATYIFFAWRAINNKPIDREEMKSEHHVY